MNLEEPLRALDAHAARRQDPRTGACRTFAAGALPRLVHLARALGMPAPVVCQPYYNLLNRMPEVEILPACAHYGIGVMPYSPIARGVLTGKYAPGQPAPGGHAAPAAATSASPRPNSATNRCGSRRR